MTLLNWRAIIITSKIAGQNMFTAIEYDNQAKYHLFIISRSTSVFEVNVAQIGNYFIQSISINSIMRNIKKLD